MKILNRLYNSFALRVLKKKVLYNFHKYCEKKMGHALLYYKTDPFFSTELVKKYFHTNNWEILEIVKILNKLGFWVDIIDRSIDMEKLELEDKYDIFIGISGGNSGKDYVNIAEKLKKPTKILYATIQEHSFYNESLKKRQEFFLKRHPGKNIFVQKIKKFDVDKIIENTDQILQIGNQFSMNTFQKYNKPIHRIYPLTNPKIKFNVFDVARKNHLKFLYLSSSDNIRRGLDILIEVFAKTPELELHICTSSKEKEFDEFYKNTLSTSKNIHWLGFVETGGRKFDRVTAKCSYIILPSSGEGTSTSVSTGMRKGLIPIVTSETGIDIKDFGFLIEDIEPDQLRQQLINISQIPKQDLIKRNIKSYLTSFDYTQARFSESFEKALINVMVKNRNV